MQPFTGKPTRTPAEVRAAVASAPGETETEPKATPARTVPDPGGLGKTLGEAIAAARTAKALQALVRVIAGRVAAEQMHTKMADSLERLISRQARLIKDAREESAIAKVRSLEILTPNEVKLLADYRRKLAGPVVQPGEAVEPPPKLEPDGPEDAKPTDAGDVADA